MAASAIANIVKSSLGPVGLDKMMVDDIGVSILMCWVDTNLMKKGLILQWIFWIGCDNH